MPGYKPFDSTTAAVQQITEALCKQLGTVNSSSLHGLWHTVAEGRYMSDALKRDGGGYFSAALRRQESAAVDFYDWGREEFELECELVEEILRELDADTLAETQLVLDDHIIRLQYIPAGQVLSGSSTGERAGTAGVTMALQRSGDWSVHCEGRWEATTSSSSSSSGSSGSSEQPQK
jgi:hypothetical protein